MVFAFKFPDLGEGIHEGKIVKWLVREGDALKADQIIAEVETDKAVVELPSPATGTLLKRYFEEGQVVQVGKIVVAIGSPGEAVPEQESDAEAKQEHVEHAKVVPIPSTQAHHFEGEAHKLHVTVHGDRPEEQKGAGEAEVKPSRQIESFIQSQQVQVAQPYSPAQATVAQSPPVSSATSPTTSASTRVLATPATRVLARELGVDLSQVGGSGPGGRVMPEDVKKHAEETKSGASQKVSLVSPEVQKQFVLPPEFQHPKLSIPEGAPVERVPLSPIRKAISQKMSESKRWVPHVTHFDEADVTRLEEIRQAAKAQAEAQGVKLTTLPFLAKAVVNSLKQFPEFNSSFDAERQELVLKKYYNLGFAVDTADGLIVVVIKNADGKGIMEFAKEVPALAEKARERKAALDEIRGGTFTITNIGSIGGVGATPIINFPEAAILGVFRAKDKPVVVEGKIVVRKIMPLCVSFDHRIIDGAQAARFLAHIVKQLEDPTLM